MAMIKLISLNVKGLNTITKRYLTLKELKSLKADIAFIQETHFDANKPYKLSSKYFPISYYSSSTHKKAGVAILIHKDCPLIVNQAFPDPEGHYLLLLASYQGTPISLLNIYSPNKRQSSFLRKTLDKLTPHFHPYLIIGGDFNMTHSQTMDRSHQSLDRSSHTTSTCFRKLMRQNSLYDSWRINHPREKQFTFYSNPHKIHTRIDYFMISYPFLSWRSYKPNSNTTGNPTSSLIWEQKFPQHTINCTTTTSPRYSTKLK
uniref:exodeoxyribonuclease III n=1 Tax=Xenopus tropicalis TaxID=8364 RepID=A0A803JH93_XENTR